MTFSTRGIAPLAEVCEKRGARRAVRLSGEFHPGPEAPFPESPEEVEWLKRRESLSLAVLELKDGAGGLAVSSWTRGGVETAEERRLDAGEVAAFLAEVEARGGWSLTALAPLAAGEGRIDLEHDAYEYMGGDAESLDLESWHA